MITVSRTFESVDEAIAFLTGASPRAKATIAASEAVEKAQATAAAAKPKVTKPAAPAPAPAPAPAAAPAAAAPAGVDYQTLQKAVFKLAGMPGGREAVIGVLTAFDVKTAKDIAQDRWDEALAAITKATAELTTEGVA